MIFWTRVIYARNFLSLHGTISNIWEIDYNHLGKGLDFTTARERTTVPINELREWGVTAKTLTETSIIDH